MQSLKDSLRYAYYFVWVSKLNLPRLLRETHVVRLERRDVIKTQQQNDRVELC